jgi:hypothetical protein
LTLGLDFLKFRMYSLEIHMPFFERDEQNNIQTPNNFAKAEVTWGIGATAVGAIEQIGLHDPSAAILASAFGFFPLMIDSIFWRMGRSSASLPWTKGVGLLILATIPTAALALTGHQDIAAYTSITTLGLATKMRADRQHASRGRR